MKSLAKVFSGVAVVAGLVTVLSGCGDKGKDNNNTAAVGTCAAGQVNTTAGCGAPCNNGAGGLVNNVCYSAINGNYNGTAVNPYVSNGQFTWNGQNCVVTNNPTVIVSPNNCQNNSGNYGYGYFGNCGGYSCASNGAFSSLQNTSPMVFSPWWMYGSGAYLNLGFSARWP